MNNQSTLQRQAKESLHTISLHDHPNHWEALYHPRICTSALKERNLQANTPILKNRFRLGNCLFTPKNNKHLLIPTKIKFQEESKAIATHFRIKQSASCKENRKRLGVKTQRLANATECSIVSDTQSEGIDYMKYLVRHRFEDRGVNALIEKIQSRRKYCTSFLD